MQDGRIVKTPLLVKHQSARQINIRTPQDDLMLQSLFDCNSIHKLPQVLPAAGSAQKDLNEPRRLVKVFKNCYYEEITLRQQ